jgi:hypothetical protein
MKFEDGIYAVKCVMRRNIVIVAYIKENSKIVQLAVKKTAIQVGRNVRKVKLEVAARLT